VNRRPGFHVLQNELLQAQASHDLDPLHVLIDVSGLGITNGDGYRMKQARQEGAANTKRAETARGR
jgi:hypothetical protein